MTPRILLVEDDKRTLEALSRGLEQEGYEVLRANNGREAVDRLARTEVDVVITDVRMPAMDGMELLESLRSLCPDTQVILMTAYATVEQAVAAIKKGAYDFVTKPINLGRLDLVIRKAIEHRELKTENIYLRQRLKETSPFDQIVGVSREMHGVFETIRQVAPTNATVLIQGESGTGKELVANAIHFVSDRAEGPLIKFSCATLADGVIESELFGHERGAFTGAQKLHRGRFELADGGTLFIDEVGEMSLATQVKFLRVLQEKEFERVGGSKTIEVDFRVIVATNKDLEESVTQGEFRQDLYYRLNVVRINVPPLRKRPEDIPLLVTHYLKVFNDKHGRTVERVSPVAMKRLMAYSWPGNVRELMNCVENIVLISKQSIVGVEDLPPPFDKEGLEEPSFTVDAITSLAELEKKAILQTLHSVGGNKRKAARILGIGVKTLYRKLEKFSLTK